MHLPNAHLKWAANQILGAKVPFRCLLYTHIEKNNARKIWFRPHFFEKNAEKSGSPFTYPKIILQIFLIQNIIPRFGTSTVNFRTP